MPAAASARRTIARTTDSQQKRMSQRNLELATFLKSRRQRLTPERVGLPPSSRRRLPTLRREDVAWLADVGITWYTWLEQGRPIKMAADTLDRIAVALRLDSSETEYLLKIVHARGAKRPKHCDGHVDERVSLLVRTFADGYAFVMGPRWDVLAWNDPYAKLLELNDEPGLERNGLWIMFTHERVRSLYPDWGALARQMVATFRLEYADYVGDLGFAELIDALAEKSADFATMWADIDVLSLAQWNVGEIRDLASGKFRNFETVSLQIPDSPGQTLVFHLPAEGFSTS